MTLLKDSMRVSGRHDLSLGETLSVVGLCIDEDTRRLLDLISGTAPVFRVRSHIASYREVQDQESMLEQLGNPSPEVCLIDFDQDRRAAAMLAERIHSALPRVALFAVSSQAHPEAILEAMRCGCGEYLSKPLDREQLVSAMDALPVHFREILLLCEVEEMSYQEIAETLSVPTGTVMSRLSRARKALRDRLRNQLEGTTGATAMIKGTNHGL